MSTVFNANIGGKNFKVGNWLLNDQPPFYTTEFNLALLIFEKYLSIFVTELTRQNRNWLLRVEFVTNDAQPFFQKSSLNHEQNLLLHHTINRLIDQGIVKVSPLISIFSSPVFPIVVEDRFDIHVDFSHLNAKIVSTPPHPIPSVQSLLASIRQANLFSAIIIKDIYHQINLSCNSASMTAFATDFGNYQFQVLRPQMKHSANHAQFLMENVVSLADLHVDQRASVKVYISGLLIHTYDTDSTFNLILHLHILESILQQLRQINLAIDVEQSYFLMKSLSFCCRQLDEYGHIMNGHNCNRLQQWPTPTNRHQLGLFLGLLFYFEEYREHFLSLTEPLRTLHESYGDFTWTAAHSDSFQSVKHFVTYLNRIPWIE